MIFRLIYLLFLFCKHNCFFLLGLSTGFLFAPFRRMYNPSSVSQAKRFVSFLQAAGPSFIKLGQILSLRIDIFSDQFIKELSNLQDRVKPLSEKKMIPHINSVLGDKINSKIKLLSYTPIACGSISQVYKGEITATKSEVAIKIIKPNIDKILKEDFKILNSIFSLFEKYTESGRITKPTKFIHTLKEVAYFELDLRYEAASCDQLRDYFKNYNDFVIPKIYWEFVSLNVLVQEWVNGILIFDLEKLKEHNISLISLSKNFVKIFFLQVFKFGFFHGDLHPGNIYVTKEGKLVFIDFGIMGKLSPTLRSYLKILTMAFLQKDYHKAAQIHFDLGWVNPPHKVEDFALACRSIMEINIDLQQQDVDIGNLLKQLFRIATKFGMEAKEELLILQKSMIYLEYITKTLSPHNNVWIMSKEVLEDNIKDISDKCNVEETLQMQLNKSAINIERYIDNMIIKFHNHSGVSSSRNNLSLITNLLWLTLGFLIASAIFYVNKY